MPAFQPLRKPVPRTWLMTDPRLGSRLLAAIQKLPAGSGVIFRHYELEERQRRQLFAAVRRICARRGHMLILAGEARDAAQWHADGFHRRNSRHRAIWHSAPVHNLNEIREALRNGAGILFLSPLRQTRSHPGQPALGPSRFGQLARLCQPAKVIALGGMNRAQAAKWPQTMVHGWAAIDAFTK
ncbi:thiamine phosphate synthase [Sphingorhabdus buctiana]|uniref:Thiamine phosphate synthase n=1 Tax=Sphingorhabdus buctiana TaxID=1508805 RepID=A0ABW4MHQ1_9SPHN